MHESSGMEAQHHDHPYDLDRSRTRTADRATSLSREEGESLWAPVSPTLGASTAGIASNASSLLTSLAERVGLPLSNGPNVNVRGAERVVSAVVGGLLVARGLRSRGVAGKLFSLLGSNLVYRGLSGHCHLYDAMGVNTNSHAARH